VKTSKDRILTTHTGSLPRPKPLVDLILQREGGQAVDAGAFEAPFSRTRIIRTAPASIRTSSASTLRFRRCCRR